MSVPFGDDIDLELNEILNAKLESLATNPSTVTEGRIFYRTDTNKVMLGVGSTYRALARENDHHYITQMSPTQGRIMVGSGKRWSPLTLGSEGQMLVINPDTRTGLEWVDQPELVTEFDSTTFLLTTGEDPNTQSAQFDLSSVSTGLTRTLTVPDKDGVIALLSDIPSVETLTFTQPLHKTGSVVGLNVTPASGLEAKESLTILLRDLSGLALSNEGLGLKYDDLTLVLDANNTLGVSQAWIDSLNHVIEAPENNETYGRRNGDWTLISGVYMRRDRNLGDVISTPEARNNIGLGITNGFPNRTDTTISTDAGTRTFTITPTGTSFYFWSASKKFTKTKSFSLTWPDEDGLHHFYFDENGDLVQVNDAGFDPVLVIGNVAYVANVYWSVTDQAVVLFGDERHGLDMDPTTHTYLHTTRGSVLVSGGAITNITTEGSGDVASNAQIGVSTLSFRDEDILFVCTDGNPQDLDPILQAPVLWRSGASGYWRKSAANDYPIMYGGRETAAPGARACYNQFTGGAWQLTEVTNNAFTLVHIFASNDTSHHYISIVGQSEYSTINDARAGAEVEVLNLLTGDLPSAEYILLATLIVQTGNGYSNIPKSRFRVTDTGDDYIDWREVRSTAAGGVAIGDHGLLSGLLDDDHTQYLLVNGTRAMTGSLNMGSNNITSVGTVDGVDVSALSSAYTAHAADATLHFTEASIDHTAILNVGSNTHAQIDTHIATSSIHYAQTAIDHLVILNRGSNTHAQIDTHLASIINPHSVTLTQAYTAGDTISLLDISSPVAIEAADSGQTYIRFTNRSATNICTLTDSALTLVSVPIVTNSTVDGVDVSVLDTTVSSHTADATIHFTEASIDHGSIGGLGDDDHTIYFRVDGDRALTGDMDAGSRMLTNVSNIGSGTPSSTRLLDFASTALSTGAAIGNWWVGNFPAVSNVAHIGYLGLTEGLTTGHALVQTIGGASALNAPSGQTVGLTIAGGSGLGGTDLLVGSSTLLTLGVPLTFSAGTSINEFSIDGTLAGDSDDAAPTEKAVKTYVDTGLATKVAIADLASTATSDGASLVGVEDADTHTDETDLESVLAELYSSNENLVFLWGRRAGTLAAGSNVRFLMDTTDNFYRHPMPAGKTFVVLAAYFRVLVEATTGDYDVRLGVRVYEDPDTTSGTQTAWAVSGTYSNSSGSQAWANFTAVGTLTTPLCTVDANPSDDGAGMMLIYENEGTSVATLPSDDLNAMIIGVFV